MTDVQDRLRKLRQDLNAAGVGSVRFCEDGETIAGHLRGCDQPNHLEYVFGVYDRWGQRVNSYRSLACGAGPYPNAATCVAAQAPLWPGYSIAVWTDTSAWPPPKLSLGPPPDASSD